MNVVLECEITLPKKFEAVCENGEPISIHVTSVSGNKGRAIMRMVCKNGTTSEDLTKIGETSIPVKVLSVNEDVKTLSNVGTVSNLIGGHLPTAVEAAIARTSPDCPEGEPYVDPRKPVVQAGQPPPPNQMSPEAMKLLYAALAAAGIPMPVGMAPVATQNPAPVLVQAPVAVNKPARDNCIASFDELISELESLPGINDVPKIPTDRKLTPREADAMMSRMPKLRRKAFVRNAMPSQLMVSDLYTSIDGGTGPCLALLPGAAYDMTRLPAKNILNSTDLKWCFETGKLEMVDGAAFAASFRKINEEAEAWSRSELTVYGGNSARTNPNAESEGTAMSLASGGSVQDESESIHVSTSDDRPISAYGGGSDDRPPEPMFEGSREMQSLVGQLPTARPQASSAPRRIR